MKIYTYKLDFVSNKAVVALPQGAVLLTAQIQPANNIVIWCEVDPEAEPIDVEFVLVPTGYDVPDPGEWEYVETFQDGPFVFHLYIKDYRQ